MTRPFRSKNVLLPAAFGVSLLAAQAVASAADWPHWRGPTRDGRTAESSGWGDDGQWLAMEPDWSKKLGIGTTSPLVYRDRVYAMGWEGKKDKLHCLELSSGKTVWVQDHASPSHGRFHLGEEALYGGPSSTPEIDTDTGLLYSLGIDGDLRCWDLNERGRTVWSLNLYDNYGVKQRPKLTPVYHRDYGYTTSPLVFGKWVIVEVGSTTLGTFVAFDKGTGKEVWRSEVKDEAGHTGGLSVLTVDGVPCLAGLTQRNLAVIRLGGDEPGKTVATQEWVTEGDCNIATPVVVGNSVLVTSGYNQKAIARFDVTMRGLTEVWRKPTYSKVCTPVVQDGSVYFSWMRVYCLDWKTGEKRWEGGSYGDPGSCVLTADGRLIVCGGRGKIGLIEGARKSPSAFKELAVRDKLLTELAWPHVAVGEGYVICRDKDGNLKRFSMSKKNGSAK